MRLPTMSAGRGRCGSIGRLLPLAWRRVVGGGLSTANETLYRSPAPNEASRSERDMAGLTPLVAGNWKMNGLRASLAELDTLKARLGGTGADVAICPPATILADAVARASGSAILVGGQDC